MPKELKTPNTPSERIQFRISTDLFAKIQVAARAEMRSANDFSRDAVVRALTSRETFYDDSLNKSQEIFEHVARLEGLVATLQRTLTLQTQLLATCFSSTASLRDIGQAGADKHVLAHARLAVGTSSLFLDLFNEEIRKQKG